MTKDAVFCAPDDSLAHAADLMRTRDCGAVPVVDGDSKVVGMITDRDICLASATRNLQPSAIKISEAAGKKVVVCELDEKIKDVLKKMRKYQIKRLPVTSQDRRLIGIISITDVLFATEKDKSLRKKVFSALKDISKPRPILLRELG